MFQKAFSLYDTDVVKRRVRTSFTAMKNRTLQRFGYDLQIEEEPFGTYYKAILHLIEVANAVKGAALHMQTSMEGAAAGGSDPAQAGGDRPPQRARRLPPCCARPSAAWPHRTRNSPSMWILMRTLWPRRGTRPWFGAARADRAPPPRL